MQAIQTFLNTSFIKINKKNSIHSRFNTLLILKMAVREKDFLRKVGLLKKSFSAVLLKR